MGDQAPRQALIAAIESLCRSPVSFPANTGNPVTTAEHDLHRQGRVTVRGGSGTTPTDGGFFDDGHANARRRADGRPIRRAGGVACLLYTSDAADDLTRVDLGGRRIIQT